MPSTSLPPAGSPLLYGTATAAYQIEGSTSADGRGASIWDTFSARPGTIADGSDGSVACGSYEHLDDDLELLSGLGVAYYRFSIAWPRIQPTGSGAVEPRGLAYYDRLVDGLLSRGIAPMATLYHWDLPQALEDAGGWPVRDTASRFADYGAIVHDHLGDRVGVWATHNEPWCAAFVGYAAGVHAPGRTEPEAAFRAAHHLTLSHALAARAMHDAGATHVGIVVNNVVVWPESDAAAGASRQVEAAQNDIWLGPLVDGAYPDDLVALAPVLGADDLVRDGDLDVMRGSLDWLGLNYYMPVRVDVPDSDPDSGEEPRPTPYPGVRASFRSRPPQTEMGWEIEPAGLEQLLVETSARVGVPLAVTENGAALADQRRDADGAVDDPDRIDYISQHIGAVERARDAGADVRAYVVWTLLDNFEWAHGFTKKFGLVEVEKPSLRRIPKASYHWFAKHVASSNGRTGA